MSIISRENNTGFMNFQSRGYIQAVIDGESYFAEVGQCDQFPLPSAMKWKDSQGKSVEISFETPLFFR